MAVLFGHQCDMTVLQYRSGMRNGGALWAVMRYAGTFPAVFVCDGYLSAGAMKYEVEV